MPLATNRVPKPAAATATAAGALAAELALLEEAWLGRADGSSRAAAQAVTGRAERVAIVACMLGDPLSAQLATDFHGAVKAAFAKGREIEATESAVFDAMLCDLRRASDQAIASSGLASSGLASAAPSSRAVTVRGRVAYLARVTSTNVVAALRARRYMVQVLPSLDALETALEATAFDAIVVDDETLCADMGAARRLNALSSRSVAGIPVVHVDRTGDPRARLLAARAGGAVVDSAEAAAVADLIDQLRPRAGLAPRVMLVDDDPRCLKLYRAVLEHEGMSVRVVADPRLALDAVREFVPDIVIMDLHMGELSGVDLCALIRQSDDLVAMPVIFLSSEMSWETQLETIEAGGDDFVPKSAPASQLLRVLRARLRRLRRLESYAVRDALTGLCNRRAFGERLRAEVSRARRCGTPLSFAMIDIDHFKAVNDTHGHPIGDRVLRCLADTLKEGLRDTDVIARAGGEEFAILLPGADVRAASRIIDEMRQFFECCSQPSPHGEFVVTLSAGVADLVDGEDGSALEARADRALYDAKRNGRNRVITALVPARRQTPPANSLRRPSSASFRAVRPDGPSSRRG